MNFPKIINIINTVLWDYLLIFLLVGVGIYYTFRLRFIQIRKFRPAMKQVFGGIFKKDERANKDGMSSFQALATAIAAQVGTGNLAGVATAIASGGPGAIFWMWVSAFFGMGTIFAEAVLAQIFKDRVDGEVTGGPAYYISKGLKNKTLAKFLAAFFAVAIIIALGFVGNMVQSNSIAASMNKAFGVSELVVGIAIAILAYLIFSGGMGRIASFTELVVPIMAILYILGCLIIVIVNYKNIGPTFQMIFEGAFNPQAIAGGIFGASVKQVIRYGVARGLFSNEAGMGSTPHAHAVAKVKYPSEQGFVAIVGVIIDTVVICTLTALVIIMTGAFTSGETGPLLTQLAFTKAFGKYGNPFIAISLLFFAFSTIIGWYFFGEANIKFLFGKKGILFYRILVLAFIILGSTLEVKLVWDMADTFNGLMVLPNIIALFVLSPKVIESLRDYEKVTKQ
ncbi:alanine/glycine:cation symporter family protein [Anaerosalibacter sp. Marseille-P3206]|uniref:alanine/glycine:cation symporter family protein n=1 Tax=Anaerosalibacter sp. Marseille-P3206 TaxID=1871005 RepID=UPI00098517AA|nr:sodium:alanine symporter family protein [Anaerosalibacter sp. Marseille-P3206]